MLKGGQLVVAGPFFDKRDSTLAITGGTGRYRNARGTMELHALANGTKFRFAFKITQLMRGGVDRPLARPPRETPHPGDAPHNARSPHEAGSGSLLAEAGAQLNEYQSGESSNGAPVLSL